MYKTHPHVYTKALVQSHQHRLKLIVTSSVSFTTRPIQPEGHNLP